MGFGEALAKGQDQSNPVTEPKRSQNPKRPLFINFYPRGYSIFEIALVVCFLSLAAGCSRSPATLAKPKLKVAPDGFPSGHSTPEGAACDLARALIRHDAILFTNSCVRAYVTGMAGADYAAFLKNTIATMKADAVRKQPTHDSPKAIGKVFAARHLTATVPASYGRASFGFQDLMFVDVGIYLNGGGHALARTLVIKDRDGKWYAHPAPNVSPSLCLGLDRESPSKQDFSQWYEIEK